MDKRLLIVAAAVMFLGTAARAASVTLRWDANTETDIESYRLFQSPRSLLATTTGQAAADAGVVKTLIAHPTLTATVSNLSPGVTYYFRLTAIDDGGGESGFNKDGSGNAVEVSTCIPFPADNTPPTVSMSQPADNATVSGAVTIAATASDAGGVAGVKFFLDGSTLLSDDIAPPYSLSWNTLSLANGSHVLTAEARDAAGNVRTSAAVNVTVSNAGVDASSPSISGLVAGNITQTGAVIAWTTNEPADTQVNYGTSTSYGQSSALNSTDVTAHSVTLSGLTAGKLYNVRARSRDAAGNLTVSGNITFTTLAAPPPGDTTPPAITNVSAGNIASGSARIHWTTSEAADGLVEYGPTAAYGLSTATDTALGTSHAMNLTGLAINTLYHYRVRSRDAAGNRAYSANGTFRTTAAPRLAVAAPAAGATVAGTSVPVLYVRSGDLSQVSHSHFQVDGGEVVEETDNDGQLVFRNVKPGSHVLSGFLVRSDHSKIAGTDVSVAFKTTEPRRNARLRMVKNPPETTANLIGGAMEVSVQLVDGESGAPLVPRPTGQTVTLHVTDDTGAKPATPLRLLPGGVFGGAIDTSQLRAVNRPVSYYCETTDPNDPSVRVVSDVMSLRWETAVTLRPDAGDPSVLSAPDGNSTDGEFSVRLPKGVALNEVSLSRVAYPPTGADAPRLVAAYDFSVPGHASYSFNKPVAITVVWRDADGADANEDGVPDGDGKEDATGLDESTFKMYWLDGQGQWKLVGGAVDKAKNSITVKTGHFSTYAVFANAAPPADPVRAVEKFLTPLVPDGRNDMASFGPEADEVTVLDANGRVHFHATRAEMNQSAITWNCRNERGQVVASGVYIAKIRKTGGQTVYQTFTVVK